VRFLQKMLIDAINARASDLHFEPYEYHYRVRFPHRRRAARDHPAADRDQGQARVAHQGHLAPGHRREARAARRPHEAEVRQQGDRLPGQHAADAVRREDRDPDLDPSSAKLGIEALGYEKIEKDRLMPASSGPTA
jgi:type IV pilus assembly protein PilB